LPRVAATTPRFRSSGASAASAETPFLTLKAPVGWKFSCFTRTRIAAPDGLVEEAVGAERRRRKVRAQALARGAHVVQLNRPMSHAKPSPGRSCEKNSTTRV
jgi:hypothetical protein